MSWIRFEHGGRVHRLAVVRTQKGVWVGWPGRNAFFAPSEQAVARVERDAVIGAPMTGKVIKVAVEVGADVQEGDLLVVMEAMKMESRLTAPRDATVEAVHCSEGELVDRGTTLVTLSK